MLNYNHDRLKQAVQYVVDSSYGHHHIKKLRSAVERPRSMPFSGDLECLNELLVVGRQSRAAFDNLIALAESKRNTKNDYQREYMAAKRQRDRKVIRLEELMVGKTLASIERTAILKRQYAVWLKEKDAFIQSIEGASWAERNAKLKEFWDRKEREVDALIKEAESHGPIKRKYSVKVQPNPKTEFGKKLASVLDRN